MTSATHHHATADSAIDEDEKRRIARDFDEAVNMTASQLRKWLDGDDAKRVGQKEGDAESVGHQSGKHIIEILSKSKGELSDADYHHMRKVIGYVHRHLAQGPTKQDPATSDWRYSLMNWGHDPQKD